MYSTQFSCRHVALIVLKKKRGGRLNRNILTSKPKKKKTKKTYLLIFKTLFADIQLFEILARRRGWGVGGCQVPNTLNVKFVLLISL